MKSIDICEYIGRGLAEEEPLFSDDRIFRLYFNQETYTPPENIDDAGSSSTFEKLKNESGQFCSTVDPVSFAKEIAIIVTKKYSFALQSTKDWQSVHFVSRSAGINMDIIFICWPGML